MSMTKTSVAAGDSGHFTPSAIFGQLHEYARRRRAAQAPSLSVVLLKRALRRLLDQFSGFVLVEQLGAWPP